MYLTQPKWLQAAFRIGAISLGGLHALAAASSHSMNADGINYLDMGDAYLRGDWAAAINPVWNPMYAWLLGIVMHVIEPPIDWEFPMVHLLNFLIYVCALFCFEFFWRQLRVSHESLAQNDGEELFILPDWAWLSLGYLLFMLTSLQMIEIWAVTPDMLMAALVYLAGGCLVRIRSGHVSVRTFAGLGLFLGCAFLAKSVMFFVGIVFLITVFLTFSKFKKAPIFAMIAILFFLILSMPYIYFMSAAKGKLTLGEAGKLSYVRYVNGLTYPHWQGGTPDNGIPTHPTRQIFESPAIYEFATPVAGTYPVSYDPSYWYDGMQADINLKEQIVKIVTSVGFYLDLLFVQLSPITFGTLLLLLLCNREAQSWRSLILTRSLLIPSVFAFATYALVLVEGRYIAVFLLLVWADLLAGLHFRDSKVTKRMVISTCTLMIIFLSLNIISFNLAGWKSLVKHPGKTVQSQKPGWPGEVTESIRQLGVQAGDEVAVIGYGFDSYWARLGRFKIIAEMLDRDAGPFWVNVDSVQSKVIDAFASTGAKAIVAEHVPSWATLSGWTQVGNSNYFIYLLNERS